MKPSVRDLAVFCACLIGGLALLVALLAAVLAGVVLIVRAVTG